MPRPVVNKTQSAFRVEPLNGQKILSNEHACIVHNKHLSSLTTPDIDYNDYQVIIIKAGELTATHHNRQFDRWFQIVVPPLLRS